MVTRHDDLLRKLQAIRISAMNSLENVHHTARPTHSFALIGPAVKRCHPQSDEEMTLDGVDQRNKITGPITLKKLQERVKTILKQDQIISDDNIKFYMNDHFGYMSIEALVENTQHTLRWGSMGNWLQCFWAEHNYHHSITDRIEQLTDRLEKDEGDVLDFLKSKDIVQVKDQFYFKPSLQTAYFRSPLDFVVYIVYQCLENALETQFKFSSESIFNLVADAMRDLDSCQRMKNVVLQVNRDSPAAKKNKQSGKCLQSFAHEPSVMHKACVKTVAVAIENLIRSSHWWPVSFPGKHPFLLGKDVLYFDGNSSLTTKSSYIHKFWWDRFTESWHDQKVLEDYKDDGYYINDVIHRDLFLILFEYLKFKHSQEKKTLACQPVAKPPYSGSLADYRRTQTAPIHDHINDVKKDYTSTDDIQILEENLKDEMSDWITGLHKCEQCASNTQCMLCFRRPQIGFTYIPTYLTDTGRKTKTKNEGRGYNLEDCIIDHDWKSMKPVAPRGGSHPGWTLSSNYDFTGRCSLFGTIWGPNGLEESERVLHLCGTCGGGIKSKVISLDPKNNPDDQDDEVDRFKQILEDKRPKYHSSVCLHHIEYQLAGTPRNPRAIPSRGVYAASPMLTILRLNPDSSYIVWSRSNAAYFLLYGTNAEQAAAQEDLNLGGKGAKGGKHSKCCKQRRVFQGKGAAKALRDRTFARFTVCSTCPNLYNYDEAWGMSVEDPDLTVDVESLYILIYHNHSSDSIQKMQMVISHERVSCGEESKKSKESVGFGFHIDKIYRYDEDTQIDEFIKTAVAAQEQDEKQWLELLTKMGQGCDQSVLDQAKHQKTNVARKEWLLENIAEGSDSVVQDAMENINVVHNEHWVKPMMNFFDDKNLLASTHDLPTTPIPPLKLAATKRPTSKQTNDDAQSLKEQLQTIVGEASQKDGAEPMDEEGGHKLGTDQVTLSKWRAVRNPGGGNCLYHSINFFLAAKETDDVKEDIMTYLEKVVNDECTKLNGHNLEHWCQTEVLGPHEFNGYVPDEEEPVELEDLTGAQYVRYQRQPNKWGGTIEIWAAAAVYNMTIVVVKKVPKKQNDYISIFIVGDIPDGELDLSKCIVLEFISYGHYQALKQF